MRIHLFDLTAAASSADDRLVRMDPRARDELAMQAQRRASELGLMRGPVPVPLVLSPCALPREELAALGRGARLITSALVKIARELIERRPERARLLFRHLSPMESAALAARWREAEELLHSRVDWFVEEDGRVRALEVNATIPAMQVYSDAAARGWAEAVTPVRTQALQRNPHNASWLIDALLAAARHRAKPPSIQLLHRDGDPQVTELRALAALLQDRGIDARTRTPADIALDADPHGVIYRHLFARYVEPSSPLGQAFLDPLRHGIWNRVDGWLETKGLFAELSMHAAKAGLLSSEERAAVADLVPWTRLLDDIEDAALGDGDGYVLKKSHDYGGKSVVIGREVGPAAFGQALSRARADEPASWVAQELVDAPAIDRFLCVETGARRLSLHLDISTFASLIAGVPDGGSVCRAAPGRVVNIVGGGGVAPLFAADVLADLL
ncbi:MAG: hypothetical protein E6J86_04040 [Deltaproteobacteria bacterium]|nr:MAG: hypothetical protein E6J86_04040 [Deltaproteobacteria bacterium]